MGGGKKSKAPATPDYSALAAQEAAASKEIAQGLTRANRPNQYDAFGNSLTWAEGPNNTWTQRINMSPQLQSQWNQYLGTQANMQNMFNYKMNTQMGGLTGGFQAPAINQFTGDTLYPNSWGDFKDYNVAALNNAQANTMVNMGNYGVKGIDRAYALDQAKYDQNSGKAVADALYGSVMDRGRKEQARETDTLTTQLRQQGLQPGTAAFDRAMQNLRTSQNDANLLAAQNATLAGAQEARDIYGAQLAGDQQIFNQLMGSEQNNLQNAAFQQQQQQQNFQNLLGVQSGNMNMFGQAMQSAQQKFNQAEAYNENKRANYETYLKGQGQRFGQELSQYNQAQQDLSWLQGMMGSPMSPQFGSFGTASGYDPAQLMSAANATFGANMGKYNSSNSKKGGLLGSGMGLGGSLLGNK